MKKSMLSLLGILSIKNQQRVYKNLVIVDFEIKIIFTVLANCVNTAKNVVLSRSIEKRNLSSLKNKQQCLSPIELSDIFN